MQEIIQNLFFRYLGNPLLNRADDAAVFSTSSRNVAFTTDSFVVQPLFFPGGDIGKLSICGTVNDLAVCGAEPQYISCGFIIEEGFTQALLIRIVKSMAHWANKAGVKVVTGDTKVVEKGAADGLFINTSGLGVRRRNLRLGIDKIKPGDEIILTGAIGEHGIAVLSKRKSLAFESEIKSDCAPLNKMLINVLDNTSGVKFMRDATRGGVATVLNEMVLTGDFGILLKEKEIPVSEGVRAACELLGLDPLYIANEGKALLVVEASSEERVLKLLRQSEYGRKARAVGEVTGEFANKVCLTTAYGARRIIEMLCAEPMPRIC